MIGQTISHYRILEELGGGGMGVVYKAEDTKLDRPVALKFLPPELTRDAQAKKRFIREAKAASALQHHNICTIHEIDETDDGRIFISMDCYEGETLKERIAGGPLPVEEALDITSQIAEGLAKAHEAGMVHRDIKPANIIITSDGLVKILDFGLAKLAGQTKVTKTGTTVGTVAYMSPEQATGSEVDHRSDIWSLGAVLYEMLAGETPFRGEHEAAVLYSIANTEPKTITQYRSDLPGDLQIIVDRTLNKDPGKRFQDSAELCASLNRLRTGRSGDGSSLSNAKANRRRITIGVIAAVIVIAVAVIVALKQPWRSRAPAEMSLAVVDFRTLGGAVDASVSAGMGILLHTGLVEYNPCHVISPQYLHEIHRRLFGTAGAPIGEDEALQVARESGATMLLSGQVAAASGRPFVTWQLVDTRSGRSLGAERVEGNNLFQLADRIITSVIPLLGGETAAVKDSPSRSIGDLTTESPEAYDHYVAGMLALETGGKESARPEFERAIDLDSTFALAHYELSRIEFTAGFNQQMGPTRYHAEQAWKHRAQLSLKDRMRLEALRQRIEFQFDDVVATYNEMLERWPDDKVLLKDLIGLLYFHWRFEEAWDVTKQAMSLYPDEWMFVAHRVNLLSLFGRGREGLRLSMVYAEKHSENAQVWHEVGQRYYELSLPDSAEIFFRRALEINPAFVAPQRFLSYCDYLRGDIDSAIANHERILERDDLLDAQRRRMFSSVSNVPDLALLHAECGRYQKAFDCIDEAKIYTSNLEDEIWVERIQTRLLLRLGRAKEVLQWARAVLQRTDGDTQHRYAYLSIARALARLDSVTAAREALARSRDIQLRWGIPDNTGKKIEAEIALAENNPQAALEALREHKRLFGELVWGGLHHIELQELLAEAYRMAGRLEEAVGVHEEMARIYGGHALSHYELGKIYLQMGRTAEAKGAFTRFLDMWADADEGLPQLEDARKQLAALQQVIQ